MSIISGRPWGMLQERPQPGLNNLIVQPSDVPTLSLFQGSDFNGVAKLDHNLTINGVTKTPTFRYKGGDAAVSGGTWSPWGYGVDLIESKGAGAAATLNVGSPLLGLLDDSVRSNAVNGSRWQASDVSTNAISTEDFVIELVIQFGSTPGVANYFFGAREPSGAGWVVFQQASNRIALVITDTSTYVFSSDILAPNTRYHILVFVNRDEASVDGVRFYVNGREATQAHAGPAAGAGTLDSGKKFTLNDRSDLPGQSALDARYALASMWKQADWHQAGAAGPAEWAVIAQERFNKLIGINPHRAVGTSTPTVQTRASVAYLDKVEGSARKLYQVGDDWLRVVSRDDANSDNIRGYLSESQKTNLLLQSEDISTTWGQLDAGDTFSLNAIAAPNKETTADGLIADATDGSHGISQTATLTAATYTMSAFVKKGDQDWILVYDGTGTNFAYFDISSGVVGTENSATGYIEDWGDGWFRCMIVYTGTAAAHSLYFRTAEADNDGSFSGDGSTVNTYVWGMQLELGDYASSYMPTTTGTVTRIADVLRFKGDDGNIENSQTGTFVADVLYTDYTNGSHKAAISLTDGTSDIFLLYARVASGFTYLVTLASGGDAGLVTGTTDLTDGTIKNLRATWMPNLLTLYVDGSSEGTPDTTVDIPDDLDEIRIGLNHLNAEHMDGVISNIKIFKTPTTGG